MKVKKVEAQREEKAFAVLGRLQYAYMRTLEAACGDTSDHIQMLTKITKQYLFIKDFKEKPELQ